MEALLQYTVTPGQFSSEYTVIGRQADGRVFSFFVPQEDVECARRPNLGEAVEGWVRVQVCQHVGHRAIVRLPRESFESGQYVTVEESQLQISPPSPALP